MSKARGRGEESSAFWQLITRLDPKSPMLVCKSHPRPYESQMMSLLLLPKTFDSQVPSE
jgi:hypothetical protein